MICTLPLDVAVAVIPAYLAFNAITQSFIVREAKGVPPKSVVSKLRSCGGVPSTDITKFPIVVIFQDEYTVVNKEADFCSSFNNVLF